MADYIENLTILHISDLHRAPDKRLNNMVLLDSLEREKEQYKKEGIPKPNLVVVSGDIVMGVKGNSEEDLIELEKQYDEAYEFMNDIANIFLDGNKSNVVIVPGNHDVSWFHSKTSMIKIDTSSCEMKKIIKNRFFDDDPYTRWCWDSFEFYDIKDRTKYSERFQSFRNFYKRFYDGNREYFLDENEQYDIFDYPEHNVTIVGFNSCYLNDHLNLVGKINPYCVSSVARKLRDSKYKGRVLIAVWHHNTKGLPRRMDYMDSSILKKFICDEYSFALHGHQHKPEIFYEQTSVDSENKLLLFSAGTLCASSKEIPPGLTRQYSIIDFNFDDKKVNIYSRAAMNILDGVSLIWQPDGYCEKTEIELSDKDKEKIKSLSYRYINEALEKIAVKDFENAKLILEKQEFEDYSVRKLLLDCYIGLRMDHSIVEKYFPPVNIQEALALIYSLKELKLIDKLKELLKLDILKESNDYTTKSEYENTVKWVKYYDR